MEIPDEDDLLNFTLEGETATFSLETGSFPVFVEEELEWLSNKDAFPAVETCFGILGDNPELVLSHKSPISVLENSISSSSNSSIPIKYPVGARSKRRRRKTPELPSQQWLNKRRCFHCQADKTPQWRAGPMGPKTLCNACGVRYKSGRLLPEYRPASSPTFSNVLHSNSHRKVVEMRKQKKQGVNEGCG